jgi:hypothetical protein
MGDNGRQTVVARYSRRELARQLIETLEAEQFTDKVVN